MGKTNKNRPVQEVEEENPWAGSLRHVDDHRKGKARKEEKEDTYGNAPWMGTLRHVVHDNKVTRNYGVNQFQSKRYPDEDAGNPFEANQGANSRPQFPLTPAAIINGSAMTRDWTRKPNEIEQEEYDEFYKSITKDKNGPMTQSHFIAEGEVTFKSLLFVPNTQP